MNSKIRGLIIFASGVVAGSIFSGLYFKKKYEQIAEDEINSVREYYRGVPIGVVESVKEAEDGLSFSFKLNESAESIREKPDIKTLVDAGHNAGTYIQYHKIVNRSNVVDEDDDHPHDDGEDEFDDEDEAYYDGAGESARIEKSVKTSPKLIKYEEYGEDPSYDTVELFYYQEDDTLADEDDKVIEDVAMIVGDALTKFDFKNNNEKIIFVRNESLQTDYQITKLYTSFEEMAMR